MPASWIDLVRRFTGQTGLTLLDNLPYSQSAHSRRRHRCRSSWSSCEDAGRWPYFSLLFAGDFHFPRLFRRSEPNLSRGRGRKRKHSLHGNRAGQDTAGRARRRATGTKGQWWHDKGSRAGTIVVVVVVNTCCSRSAYFRMSERFLLVHHPWRVAAFYVTVVVGLGSTGSCPFGFRSR